jgi:hypothetical protein
MPPILTWENWWTGHFQQEKGIARNNNGVLLHSGHEKRTVILFNVY